MKKGKVTLVGAGPGSRDLLTLRALEVIRAADVVLYDQLAGEIIAMLPEEAEKIDCGKFGGKHTLEQEEIEALMVRHACAGKNVVRLKGGDPFLFGRGGEELEVLRAHDIPVELVPGVTSAIAVPGCVGIPVTHRRYASHVTFVTGHEDPAKGASAIAWEALARAEGTIVVLMGVKNLAEIVHALTAHGRDPATPVAIIERGMQPGERVTIGTLADIVTAASGAGVRPPAVIVIGDVVRLYSGGHLCRDTAGGEPRPH